MGLRSAFRVATTFLTASLLLKMLPKTSQLLFIRVESSPNVV